MFSGDGYARLAGVGPTYWMVLEPHVGWPWKSVLDGPVPPYFGISMDRGHANSAANKNWSLPN